MITFLPRDIGLWRDAFTFGLRQPPMVFVDDIDELKKFCHEHGVPVDDPRYPFHVDEDGYVIQWTVIGRII